MMWYFQIVIMKDFRKGYVNIFNNRIIVYRSGRKGESVESNQFVNC